MKLTCTGCQQQIVLDDSKIPVGVFKVKCPKCGKIVTGQKAAPGQGASVPSGPAVSAADELQAACGAQLPEPQTAENSSGNGDNSSPDIRALVKREVGHLKKEILGSLTSLFGGTRYFKLEKESQEDADDDFGKKALICEDDPAYVEIIASTLKRMGYRTETANSTAEALKKVETGSYDLITVDYVFPDDKDGGVKIIARINGQKPAVRRETFVVLISANVKSADASAAFFHGANITVNKEEIRHLERLIREGQRRFHDIYRVFNRILEEKSEKT